MSIATKAEVVVVMVLVMMMTAAEKDEDALSNNITIERN